MHRLFGESRRRDPPLFSRLSLFSFPLLLFFLPPSLPLLFFASGHIGPSLSPRWLSLCRASAIAAIHQPRAIFAIIMEGWAESAAFSRSYCSFPPSSSFPKVEQTRVPFRCHSRRAFHLLVKGTFFIVEEGTFFNCRNDWRKRRFGAIFFGKLELEEISRSLKSARRISEIELKMFGLIHNFVSWMENVIWE